MYSTRIIIQYGERFYYENDIWANLEYENDFKGKIIKFYSMPYAKEYVNIVGVRNCAPGAPFFIEYDLLVCQARSTSLTQPWKTFKTVGIF